MKRQFRPRHFGRKKNHTARRSSNRGALRERTTSSFLPGVLSSPQSRRPERMGKNFRPRSSRAANGTTFPKMLLFDFIPHALVGSWPGRKRAPSPRTIRNLRRDNRINEALNPVSLHSFLSPSLQDGLTASIASQGTLCDDTPRGSINTQSTYTPSPDPVLSANSSTTPGSANSASKSGKDHVTFKF